MALSEITKKLAEKHLTNFCKMKSPPELADRVRLNFEIDGNSATLFEVRLIDQKTNKWFNSPIARFRFFVTKGAWELYFCDSNQKWHKFDLIGPSADIEKLIVEVDRDSTGIFWG